MDIDRRAAALRKWHEDGEVIRAAAAKWRVQGEGFDVAVDVVEEVGRDGSLVRRLVVRDPPRQYLELVYYLRPDNLFQAHWGAGLGNAEFFGFKPHMYESSIATHLSGIFKKRGWPEPKVIERPAQLRQTFLRLVGILAGVIGKEPLGRATRDFWARRGRAEDGSQPSLVNVIWVAIWEQRCRDRQRVARLPSRMTGGKPATEDAQPSSDFPPRFIAGLAGTPIILFGLLFLVAGTFLVPDNSVTDIVVALATAAVGGALLRFAATGRFR